MRGDLKSHLFKFLRMWELLVMRGLKIVILVRFLAYKKALKSFDLNFFHFSYSFLA